jgi:hypothetical protein
MTLWIMHTSFEGKVVQDLRKICPDPGLEIEMFDAKTKDDHSGRVRYDGAKRTMSSLGCQMVAALADAPQHICISGQGPTYLAVPANPMAGVYAKKLGEVHGQTGFWTAPTVEPLPKDIAVLYDPTDDNGAGYWVYPEDAASDVKVPSSSDAILFHELAHARNVLAKKYLGISLEAYQRKGEDDAVADENQYLESLNRPRRRKGGGSGLRARSGCFMATAAYGSEMAPEVQELREFRDNVLLPTRAGGDFFAAFYADYYRFSPEIAAAMRADATFHRSMRVGIVAPLAAYLRIVTSIPHAGLDDVPEPWRTFLRRVLDDRARWTAELPLPADLRGLTPGAAIREIVIVLDHVLVDPDARHAWLRALAAAGSLPVEVPDGDRDRVLAELERVACAPEDIRWILEGGGGA